MKLVYSILISFLILLQSFSNVIIYLNFKINQEAIAKTLCIQREMKINKCNGNCYLSKQLKKEAEKEKQQSSLLKEKQEVLYVPFNVNNSFTTLINTTESKIIVSLYSGTPKSISTSIFRPPLV